MNKGLLNAIRKKLSGIRNSTYFTGLAVAAFVFTVSVMLIFFFEKGYNSQFSTLADSFWWTIITFSTTGYGDKIPVTVSGRILTVFTIFFGVVSMSFLSGIFASAFIDRKSKNRRGLMDFSRKKDHIIICGWKEQMDNILNDIIRVGNDINPSKLVLISNIDADRVAALKETDALKGLMFVRGDYFSENALKRANIRKAKKVIVLADTFENKTESETDSKTVMTIFTIKSMVKDIYTCAELLDLKYENYLRHVKCDEIIFPNEFSRKILASATAVNGMSNIIFEMLSNSNNSTRLLTEKIPEIFIGKKYRDFRYSFDTRGNRVLIGILENTGSPYNLKIEALRDAQKTSDVSMLVENFKNVKDLKINSPVFVPDDEYVISSHSMAIILENKRNSV